VPWLLRVAWRSWLPLAAMMQHVVFWRHPLDVWRAGSRWQFARCAFSVVWLFAAYAGLHWAWPSTFNFRNFGLAIAIYLAAVELVNLPHHADRPTIDRKLALWEQAYSTRSCYYPVLVSELLVLNFNFHIEHHLFPSLPWYRLRQARGLVKEALEGGYEEAVGIEWNLRHRSTDIRNVLRT
jgi:fatty acid desaturase